MPLSGPVCILSCQKKTVSSGISRHHYHNHRLSSPHTHTVITFSDMQHSDNCKDGGRLRVWVWDRAQKKEASLVWGGQDQCGTQPCLDPVVSVMREGMVGDKSTSPNSMGHFSRNTALTLSTVCLRVWRTETFIWLQQNSNEKLLTCVSLYSHLWSEVHHIVQWWCI